MKRIFTKFTLGAAALVIAVFSLSTVQSFTGGPPDGLSGGLGEGNCTQCHGGTVNSGGATVVIAPTDTSVRAFVPGNTYEMKISVLQSTRQKFGFQLRADVGTLAVVETGRTQISILRGKQYLKHTGNGTITGNSWLFSWTAPADTSIRNVTFYASGMESNNANGNGGDLVYTTSREIPRAAPVGIVKPKAFAEGLTLYPNPVGAVAHICFNLTASANPELSIIDLQGKVIATKALGQMPSGKASIAWALPTVASGTYILHVKAGDKVSATRMQKL